MGLGDDIGAAIDEITSNLVVRESDWKFVTSGGAAVTVSTPIARVGINAGGGMVQVQRDSDSSPTTLVFGGIGGSIGLSLVPTPANFSFSIPAMPSAGRIYKLPFAGWTLTKDELQGAFVMIEAAGDFGPGGAGALMFMGGSVLAAGAIGGMTYGAGALPTLIATAECCVAFGGMTASLIPANVSLSVYVGIIGDV